MARAISKTRFLFSPEEDYIVANNNRVDALRIIQEHPIFSKNNRTLVGIEVRKSRIAKGAINLVKRTKVVQLKEDMTLVNVFEHIYDAGNAFSKEKETKKRKRKDPYPATYKIREACDNLNTRPFGFGWMYLADYLDNIQLKPILKKKPSKLSIKVVQLSLSREYVGTWDSATSASKTLNIPRSNIVECCSGKHKTAANFKWMYYSSYKKLLKK